MALVTFFYVNQGSLSWLKLLYLSKDDCFTVGPIKLNKTVVVKCQFSYVAIIRFIEMILVAMANLKKAGMNKKVY